MESKIVDSRIVGTFTWTIKNFSRWFEPRDGCLQSNVQDFLSSPSFTFEPLKQNWFLLGVKEVKTCDKNISFVIAFVEKDSDQAEAIQAEFELSLLASDGSALIEARAQQPLLGKFPVEIHCPKIDEILAARKAELLPNDTLTVRCRIRMKKGNGIEKPGVCYGRTEILLENGLSVLSVERFSSLKVGQKRVVDLDTNVPALSPMKVVIYLADNGDDVKIEIAYSDSCSIRNLLEISALDCFGNVLNSSAHDFLVKTGEYHELPNRLRRNELVLGNPLHLPNDTLFLRCRYRVLYVCEIQYGLPFYKDSGAREKVTGEASRGSEKNASEFSLSLIKDMAELFEKGVLSDVYIRVDTDIFPAHKVVLSARSPVFKRMFITSEKYASYIDLPDFDTDTVRLMLKYMYTDVVEDLLWDRAESLYVAAIRYELFLLKNTCSSFLKANLSTVNVCKALVLADTQHDDDLKNAIQLFIMSHKREVLRSKQWKHLKTNHGQLAFETMESVCLGNLMNK